MKFYVDDIQVWVTAEAIYHLDPETDRLRLVEYRDFVADVVRTPLPRPQRSPVPLGQPGRSPGRPRRARRRGVSTPTELGERTGLVEADPLDVLVHLAWNQPLATRTDRARRVRKEHADFFEAYQPEAREVLDPPAREVRRARDQPARRLRRARGAADLDARLADRDRLPVRLVRMPSGRRSNKLGELLYVA